MIARIAPRRPVWAILGIAALVPACGDNTAPATVASVEVTSPIGALLDVGGGAQLAALAKDAQGVGVSGVSFTWTSTNPSVVSVSSTGLIQAQAVGAATIRAAAGGATGNLALTVVDADLAGISALGTDPYVAALVGGTSSGVKTAVQAAVAQCTSGVQQGNLQNIQSCIAAARSQATGATDPTDRALLAVLNLFVDQIERLLGV